MRALPFIILAIGVVEQAHLFARAEEDEPDIEPDSEPSFEFEDTAEPDIEDTGSRRSATTLSFRC